MNLRMRASVAAALCVAAGLSVGCKTDQCADDAAEDKAACQAPKPGVITTANTMCVIVNEDPVNPAVEPVEWKGQKIGFCCKGCKPKWAAMTDAEKDAAVAKAMKASGKS